MEEFEDHDYCGCILLPHGSADKTASTTNLPTTTGTMSDAQSLDQRREEGSTFVGSIILPNILISV